MAAETDDLVRRVRETLRQTREALHDLRETVRMFCGTVRGVRQARRAEDNGEPEKVSRQATWPGEAPSTPRRSGER